MSETEHDLRRWVPVHQGDTYCSPGCGVGCTWASYVEARDKATRLAAEMGPDWKPRVWENLGWYWSAVGPEAHVEISPSPRMDMWSCSVGDRGVLGRGNTPAVALRAAIACASQKAGEWQEVVSLLQRAA